MRILCINLNSSLSQKDLNEFAEVFLKYSSKIKCRNNNSLTNASSYIFIDIKEALQHFTSEDLVFRSTLALARKYFPEATAAISDTPFAAQVFSCEKGGEFIIERGKEREELGKLSIKSLIELEGIDAWEDAGSIYSAISLFQILGLNNISQLYGLRSNAFTTRWGKDGEQLWKRINHLDIQKLSRFENSDSLSQSCEFQAPVALLSYLFFQIENKAVLLSQRLHGRNQNANAITLSLNFSDDPKSVIFDIELASPSNDKNLIMEAIERQISNLSLSNPVTALCLTLHAEKNLTQSRFGKEVTSPRATKRSPEMLMAASSF